MTHSQSSCDLDRLSRCASGQLSEDDERRLGLHVEHCSDCRTALELSAANPEDWDRVRHCLPDDADDLEFLSDHGDHEPGRSPGVEQLLDSLSPTDDPRMMGRFGPYEVAGVIGVGGMGLVLKAFDPALARFVALKTLHPHLWHDDESRARFLREARAAASVVHDNVVEIYGVSEANGIPYFTMPYLRGDSLQKRINDRGALDVEEILRIGTQIAAGLAEAHSQGLVHRDIKPDNVMLADGAERVRLTDFGLARGRQDAGLTRTGVIAGTPQYLSPEQVRGDTVDHRSDLFSLGSLIYTMCTGRAPFEAETSYALLSLIANESPPRIESLNAGIPSWLAAIVDRLHARSPGNRYQSAEELSEDLKQCLAHIQDPNTNEPPRSVRRLEARYARRPWSLRTFSAGVAVLLLVSSLPFAAALWPQGEGGSQTAGRNGVAPPVNRADRVDVKGRVVDMNGRPLAGVEVLSVRKTWPGQVFTKHIFRTTTDKDGRFRFKSYAKRRYAYAAVVSVAHEGYALHHEEKLSQVGTEVDEFTLRLEPAEPVELQLRDLQGQPLRGITVCPALRVVGPKQVHAVYGEHINDAGRVTDNQGRVTFTAWKPTETGSVHYMCNGRAGMQQFQVGNNGQATLTINPQVGQQLQFGWNPDASEPDPTHVAWLADNAIPIRSIRSDDNDFDDLQPLKEKIGDARIVQLGEQSHGDGSTFAVKIRLIRFLHQEMGFDVLAFEGGLYDCAKAWKAFQRGDDPFDAGRMGVLPIWSHVNEVQPLFRYVSEQARSDHPLEFIGVDSQITGSGAWLADDLTDAVKRFGGDRVDARTLRTATEGLTIVGTQNKAPAQPDNVAAALERIRGQLKAKLGDAEQQREVAWWKQVLKSLQPHVRTFSHALSGNLPAYNNARDRQMSGNLVWLARKRYPNRRIIVWAASTHILRNNDRIETPGNRPVFTSMGTHLHRELGDDVYTIGFTAYYGTRGAFGQSFPLAPAIKGTFEELCHQAGLDNAFIDLSSKADDAKWLRERIPARPCGYAYDLARWPEHFDAMIYNRTMTGTTRRLPQAN